MAVGRAEGAHTGDQEGKTGRLPAATRARMSADVRPAYGVWPVKSSNMRMPNDQMSEAYSPPPPWPSPWWWPPKVSAAAGGAEGGGSPATAEECTS